MKKIRDRINERFDLEEEDEVEEVEVEYMDSTGQKRDEIDASAAGENNIQSFGNLLDMDDDPPTTEPTKSANTSNTGSGSGIDELLSIGVTPTQSPSLDPMDDLLGMGSTPTPPMGGGTDDFLGMMGGPPATVPQAVPDKMASEYVKVPDKVVFNPSDAGQGGKTGLGIKASF